MQRIASLWKSSLGGKVVIVLVSLFTSCLLCVGFGSLLPNPPTAEPTQLSAKPADTSQPPTQALPSTTPTSEPTATDIPIEQYASVAISRFQTLKEAIIELTSIHNQFLADITKPQSDPWYSHALITMFRVTDGSMELAGMNNYPPEFQPFHQIMLSMSQEGESLKVNYMAALDNQDAAALNNATVNLSNIITYLNNASSSIDILIPTSTPAPTAVNTPTSTPLIFIQPTSANVGYDNNGDGKVTCADFQTQAAAQRAYNAGYTNLDGNDKDGKVCETLP